MPIVERERELSSLRRALESVGDPGARSIAIVGPPGIGKSALISAIVSENSEWLLLAAAGTPLGVQVPHGLILQLFGGLARSSTPDESPFDGPGVLLRELLVEGAVPADSAALAYSLQWAVARLAEERRVLLVVDDLHWADPSSLSILGHALGLLGAEPVALVFGIRGTVGDLGDPVLSAIVEASTIVTPGPLSLEGVAAIVGESGPDAARVHELSGGIPFYVTELVSMAAAGQELTSSRQVTASVGGRLDRLGPAHREVARAVAALGPDAGPTSVAWLAGVTAEELTVIVNALVADGILADAVRPTLAHPLVGEAIRLGLGAGALTALHDRAARVLGELGESERSIASHLLHSPVGRDEWRFAVLQSVGRAAVRAGSPSEAVLYLDRAIAELRDDDPRRLGLLLSAADASMAAGDGLSAAAYWRESLGRIDDIGERSRVLADLGDALFGSGDYATAESVYEQGTAELAAAGIATTEPVFREFVARTLSVQLSLTMTPSALSREVLQQTIDQDPSLDTAEDSRLLAAAAVGLTVSGDPDGRTPGLALRAYRSWPRTQPGMADDPTTYLLSGALNFASLFPEGIELLTDAVTEAASGGRALSEATARYCRGAMHLSEGDLRKAAVDLVAAVNAVRLGWSHYRESAETLLIRCHLDFGSTAAAAAIALSADYRSASGVMQSVQLVGRADYWTRVGRPAHGLELARQAGGLNPVGAESMGLGWRGSAVAALLALGRVDEARELALEEVGVAEDSGGHAAALGPALLRLARVAEDRDEAIATARVAHELAGPARRLELFHARELLGTLLVAEGASEEAGGLLESALDYAQSQGLASAERRMRSALASIGRAVMPSTLERRISSLSASEHRVASLAAQGLSNREIAGSLFVTLKTIEFHLSRCYRKLGVQTRRDLSVLFERAETAG